jgi:hypothetical protein
MIQGQRNDRDKSTTQNNLHQSKYIRPWAARQLIIYPYIPAFLTIVMGYEDELR